MHNDNVLKHICAGVFAPEQLAWSVVKNNALWLTRHISEWMTEIVSQTCSSRKRRKMEATNPWEKTVICSWNTAAPNSSEAELRSYAKAKIRLKALLQSHLRSTKTQTVHRAWRNARRMHSIWTELFSTKNIFGDVITLARFVQRGIQVERVVRS